MRRIINKSIAIILVITLFYCIIGEYIFYKGNEFYVKENAREKIKAGIPVAELVIIKLSLRNFKTIVEDDELCYNGQWLDIIKKNIKKDTVYLYCYNDKPETRLNISYSNKISRGTDINSPSSKIIQPFFKKLSRSHFSCAINTYPTVMKFNFSFIYRFICKQHIYCKLASPPPRQVC